MKKIIHALVAVILGTVIISGCGGSKEKQEMALKEFIKKFEAKYIPLYKEYTLASWEAETTLKEEAYTKSADAEFALSKIFSNKEDFEFLKKIKESGDIKDTLLKRQLDVLYLGFLGKQMDSVLMKKMIDQQSLIAKTFNSYRPILGTDTITDNIVETTLRESTDNKKLEEVWKASKKSGAAVSSMVIELVKRRNEVAQKLGFKNYHEMSLKLSEQDPAEIEKLFDELDVLTRDAFVGLKDEMDTYFANRYKLDKKDLMPWHYQNRFFQEAPTMYPVDLDAYYKNQDIITVTEKYFDGIGLPISEMLKKSDMLERKDKNQHAFCTDIDRMGDVRILCNSKNNANWMNTNMHEFGHGIYSKYNDPQVPWILRDAAHTFTTEAIAMFFGRMASNPKWMEQNVGITPEESQKIAEDCYKTFRLEQLTFSRWAQVMYRFEKGMYEDPTQDLNKLWWDIVEKYQMLKRPADRNEPDWASKIHIALYPCYYHNYLMGELLASQLTYSVAKNVYKTEDVKSINYSNNKEVGNYFLNHVFKPGMIYEWNNMIEKATGEKLTAKYYAKQFVE